MQRIPGEALESSRAPEAKEKRGCHHLAVLMENNLSNQLVRNTVCALED